MVFIVSNHMFYRSDPNPLPTFEGDERQQDFGIQEWDDGSRYEGGFVNGLKHGKGKYTWKNGEVR